MLDGIDVILEALLLNVLVSVVSLMLSGKEFQAAGPS